LLQIANSFELSNSKVWFHAKGKARLKTKNITGALIEAKRKRLVNPFFIGNSEFKKRAH
jgi:hypothetical protein